MGLFGRNRVERAVKAALDAAKTGDRLWLRAIDNLDRGTAVQALVAVAEALFDDDLPERAREALDQALARDPESREAIELLAEAEDGLGHVD